MKLKSNLIFAGLAAAVLAGTPVAGLAQDTDNKGAITSRRVTIKVDAADLRYALKLLFEAAGANYSLDQSVQGTVTVSMQDVPFRTALESVLRSTQSERPLTYRIEDGVYQIFAKSDPPPVGEGPIELTIAPAQAPPRQKVGKINLNYADVRDILAVFGGTMIENRFSQLGMGGMGGMGGFGTVFGNSFGVFGMGGFGQGMGFGGPMGFTPGNAAFGFQGGFGQGMGSGFGRGPEGGMIGGGFRGGFPGR